MTKSKDRVQKIKGPKPGDKRSGVRKARAKRSEVRKSKDQKTKA